MRFLQNASDSKVLGVNTGPIWGRQDPGGPHVDPMNPAIWGSLDDPSLLQTAHNMLFDVLW